jgi:hypothetical protein
MRGFIRRRSLFRVVGVAGGSEGRFLRLGGYSDPTSGEFLELLQRWADERIEEHGGDQ